MIYAIQCGANGPIKLGIAKNAEKRLANLQVANHEKLQLVITQETYDDHKIELELHRRCTAHHIRGEWFRPEGEVLVVIEEMRSAKADWADSKAWAGRIAESYRSHMAKYALLQLIALLNRFKNGQSIHQG
jgi:agmatine/peptidylarginine deiminase